MIRKLVGLLARNRWVATLLQHRRIWPALLMGHKAAAARTWSQHGEDHVLVKLLADEVAGGFYVDVGANHPAVLSNTFRLYCLGMRGITIEPNDLLCGFHQQYRPGDRNICAGVSDRDGLLEFYELNYHAFSTFSLTEAEARVATGWQIWRRSLKPVFRLDTVLRDVKLKDRTRFTLLSVDTEGFDQVVLRSNDWSKHRPRYLLVEFNDLEARDETGKYLSNLGYGLMQTFGCNGLYHDQQHLDPDTAKEA